MAMAQFYMDLLRMIAELQDERHRLDEAIEALERLSASNKQRRRGRPTRGSRSIDQPIQTIDKAFGLHSPKDQKG